MKAQKFSDMFLELLSELKNQNRILANNLNLNFINNNIKPETHLFLDGNFTNNFLPQLTQLE